MASHLSEMQLEYIRRLATAVRGGTTNEAYSLALSFIKRDLDELAEGALKDDALQRLQKIDNYQFIHIEDPAGSRAAIANEIEALAEFLR